MAWDGVREPVRATGGGESARLTQAAQSGPYVAWRDAAGELQIHALGPRTPATIGRSQDGTVQIDHPQVSREHAEVTARFHGEPLTTSVYLLDYSRHGTEHRRVMVGTRGAGTAGGAWQKAPRAPARACQLEDGAHDIRIAGERYLLVGGVPVDDGITADREDPVTRPTVRQRQVLVELCRPFFAAPDEIVSPPTNAYIARQLDPVISEDQVSTHMTDMYKRYGIHGTSTQNRLQLVNLARKHDLVDASDYL